MGFANIQTRRFQRLKLSIADRIQSCEFSYNYLTQDNTHIKDVLDRKTLGVEKTKFMKIIKISSSNKGPEEVLLQVGEATLEVKLPMRKL